MSARFENLWSKALDGQATPAEAAELEQLLESDPALRQAALRDMRTAGLLGQLSMGQPDFTAAMYERIKAETDGSRFVADIEARLQRPSSRQRSIHRSSRRRSRPSARPAVAALSVLLGALFVGLLFFAAQREGQVPDREPTQAAITKTPVLVESPRITQTSGFNPALRSGGALPLNRLVEVPAGEQLRFTWPDGSHFTLHGPASLTHPVINTPTVTIQLDAGELHCQVAPQESGRQVEIATAQSTTTVIGTRFTVSANTIDEVAVKAGQVRVARNSDAAVIDLHANQITRIADGLPLNASSQVVRARAVIVAQHPDQPRAQEHLFAAYLSQMGITSRFIGPEAFTDDNAAVDSADVIVIMRSVSSNRVEDAIQLHRHIPSLCLDPSVVRHYGISDRREGDWLDKHNTRIEVSGAHPITTGLSGVVEVLREPDAIGFTDTVTAGTVLAHWPGKPERATVIVRDREADHDRIVFLPFFMDGKTLIGPTDAGWQLINNAIEWLIAD